MNLFSYFLPVVALSGSLVLSLASTAPAQPLTTRFECVEKRPSGYATIARRGDLVTAPLLTWDNTLGGGWTPEKRCETVTTRFNEAVDLNGGKLSYLRLTYGPVNNQTVICYTDSGNRPCSSSTMLFTLSPGNAENPKQVLTSLKAFALSASGQAIQESPPQLLYETEDGRLYFDLGEWSERTEWRSAARVTPEVAMPSPFSTAPAPADLDGGI